MNTKSGDLLNFSAETGNIKLLYAAIQEDRSILENIDRDQFVETPLHISASKGHIKFATEIMNLKPSFAMKLNMHGYSPIHLAMDSRIHLTMDSHIYHSMDDHQKEMVSNLVGINKDVVRVKGREGLTPLHFACLNGEVELLAEFLTACPDSIEDVNVNGESALHIAVLNHQFEALEVLVGWLKGNCRRGAEKLEEKILNHKDKAGNTVLHISALSNDPKFLQLLVNTQIQLNAKNSENETALDLASTPEIKNILVQAKAKRGSDISKAPSSAAILRSKSRAIDKKTWSIGYIITFLFRMKRNVSKEQRNTWLIVATIVATATYESALNPPGGVFQVSASDDKNVKITSTDFFYSTQGNAGKSILSKSSFAVFSYANMISFAYSTIVMILLTPTETMGITVCFALLCFVVCYLTALLAISPTHFNTIILYIPISAIGFEVCYLMILFKYFNYQQYKKLITSD